MTHEMKSLAWLGLLLGLAPGLSAQTEFPQLARLRVVVEQEASAKKKSPDQPDGASTRQSAQLIQIQAELAQSNYPDADLYLQHWRQREPSPAVSALLDELSNAIRDLITKREADFAKRVDELAEQAAALCLKATEIKELDALQLEMATTQTKPKLNNNSAIVQTALQKLNAARTVTQRWQDYLDYLANGNPAAAQQVMRDLANNSNLYSVLPRSEYLVRARPTPAPPQPPPQPEPEPASLTIETLEEVRALLTKIRMPRNSRGRAEVSQFQSLLAAVDEAARELERGDAQPVLRLAVTYPNYGAHPDGFRKLMEKLTLQALTKEFQTDETLQPKPDESLNLYTARVAEAARKSRNWPLLIRCLDIMSGLLSAGMPPHDWLQRDRSSMGFFSAGLAQEKAGDLTPALESYRRALSNPGRYLPTDAIAERIKALRK